MRLILNMHARTPTVPHGEGTPTERTSDSMLLDPSGRAQKLALRSANQDLAPGSSHVSCEARNVLVEFVTTTCHISQRSKKSSQAASSIPAHRPEYDMELWELLGSS